MRGKQKCRILKQIRQRIADENDIPYVTRECSYQGACSGTCPRCESELRYLEQQLERCAALGKKVSVAALCAGLTLGAAGCAPFGHAAPTPEPVTDLGGAVPFEEPTSEPTPEIFVTEGEVAWPEEGDETVPDPELEPMELLGDVDYTATQTVNG